VKTTRNLGLTLLVLSLLVTPALGQKGHSNKEGASRGDARADLVQSENRKKDKDHDPDNDKNKGKHNGETKGKAKSHRH